MFMQRAKAIFSLKKTVMFRAMSTAAKVANCGFTEDFPNLLEATSFHNKALYNHLHRVKIIDQEIEKTFMALTEKVDEKSQDEMNKLRKEMAKNAQKVAMYDQLKKLFLACEENT